MPAFNSLKEKQIPNRANVLDVFYATDSHKVFIGLGDGSVICLNDLLHSGPPARCIGPEGPAGRDCVCRNGKDGKDGRDGRDGAPGINAPGIVGPQGRPGVDGKDSIANPERVANLETAASDLRAETAARKKEIADLKATLQAIVDMNNKTGLYLEWLREKAAARAKESACL
jgi:hypothetical protein